MSDESQSPPLRLKPRVRSEEAAPPAPVVPVKSSTPVETARPPSFPPTAAEAESSMRLRLKPKLTVEAEPKMVTPASLPRSVPLPAKVQPAPDQLASDTPTNANDIPRLKLKPLQASTNPVETLPVISVSAPLIADVDVGIPAPPLSPPLAFEEAVDASHPSVPLLKPLAVIKTDDQISPVVLARALVAPFGEPFKPPARASLLSTGRVFTIVGALLILVGGIYYAYRAFSSAAHPVPVVIAPIAPVHGLLVATPTIPVSKAPALQEKIVAQALPAPVVENKQPEPSPTVKPVPPPVRVSPLPNTNFLVWVETVKISGVFPPRAIVNGLLVRPGDMIDPVLGVIFDHLDVQQRKFFFRDRSGAVTSKSY